MENKAKINNTLPPSLFKFEKKGKKIISKNQYLDSEPKMYYKHKSGELWQGDSIEWLKTLEAESVDLIFADPPYNIKKAEWDNFDSQEEYINWSMLWIKEAARVLKSTGSLYICGFSEILADLKHPASKYFKSSRWLVWFYKNKANLGKDWGRSHESILLFRKTKKFTFNIDFIRIPYGNHTLKYPNHTQAKTSQYANGKTNSKVWTPNPLGAKPKDVFEIPTINNGMKEKTPHPTQKPEELVRKIILASSNENDLVLDPFCGSGTTPVCAEQLKRKWLACDLSPKYLDWSIERLESVPEWTIEKWIKFDFDNLQRRNSIR